MKPVFIPLIGGFVLSLGLSSCYAQETEDRLRIKEYTIMEHYEPELVIPPDERRRLKIERRQEVMERKGIISELNIPERKKRRLLRELYSGPFTDHYDKVLGSLENEPDKTENPD